MATSRRLRSKGKGNLPGHFPRCLADRDRSYRGFNPGAKAGEHPPVQKGIAWWNDAIDTGPVWPHGYNTPDIICHLSATPAQRHARVSAGSDVKFHWNQFHPSHHGPIINYMAKCPGSCAKVDKTQLEFFKVSETGLESPEPSPGTWATDDMRDKQDLSWTVQVPPTLAPGNYVLRHELIALHDADKPDHAQNYPQCINLKVTGTGTDVPPGIPATKFYKPTDPGIFISIWWPRVVKYIIPGPPLCDSLKHPMVVRSAADESMVGAGLKNLFRKLKRGLMSLGASKEERDHPRDLVM